ncbi:MAG: TonB-dependent receptor plug domain-containing protein [Flavobacteriaceae bacterium]|nr:TonB-dependent receptor plug domain-containing protein [Flavobacteriaceae bacterium]
MKFRLLQNVLAGMMMLVGTVVYSQTTVSGQVLTDEGPVPGVNVIVKGTTTGAATDFDGNYTIENVPSDAVLEFSFLGYVTQSVPVNGRSSINVTLLGDSQALEEVVVIGYGTVKKSDATGAVDAIGSDDFTTANANSPAQILRGKVAGVQVTQSSGEPGGAVNIRVRGNSSLRSGNDPLIVVDGVPLSGGNVSAGGSDAGLGSSTARNPLNFINQNDIESINILKDASSTAIYGSRGANGVILITTKKGKAGKPAFEFSTIYGVSNQAKSDGIDMMSSGQYAEQARLSGAPQLDHGSSGYNYEDAILRSAVSTSYDFSAGFSGDGSRTRMSMGIVQQEGIVKETGMDKYSFSLNNSLKAFNDRVSFDAMFWFRI